MVEPDGECGIGGRRHDAMGHGTEPAAFGADHAPPHPAEAGIDAKDCDRCRHGAPSSSLAYHHPAGRNKS